MRRIFVLFIVSLILFSCKKEKVNPKSSLEIIALNATDSLELGDSVKIVLYKSWSDFNSQTNPVSEKYTNTSSRVTFEDLDPSFYAFVAFKGSKNNYSYALDNNFSISLEAGPNQIITYLSE